VILDHCTDRTEEAVSSIRDSRVNCIINNGKPGISPSLNAGLAAARADLLARLDADDVQVPDRFTTQMRCLRDNSLDVCAGWAQLVDSMGEPAYLQTTPGQSEAIRRALRRSNVIVHSSVLMKRETLLGSGGYRRTRWEDYDLWVRLSRRKARFGCVQSVVVTRELRPGGYGATSGRSLLGRAAVLRHRLMAARAMGEFAPW
jgi:glycosyltransferase involved in cell wall biosynthesis